MDKQMIVKFGCLKMIGDPKDLIIIVFSFSITLGLLIGLYCGYCMWVL